MSRTLIRWLFFTALAAGVSLGLAWVLERAYS